MIVSTATAAVEALNILRSWPLVCDQRSQNWTLVHRQDFRGGLSWISHRKQRVKIISFFIKRTSTWTCWEVILVWNPGTTKLKLYGFRGPGTLNNQPSIGTWNNLPLVQGTCSWNLKLSLSLSLNNQVKTWEDGDAPLSKWQRPSLKNSHRIPWNLHLLKGDQPKGIYQNELSL